MRRTVDHQSDRGHDVVQQWLLLPWLEGLVQPYVFLRPVLGTAAGMFLGNRHVGVGGAVRPPKSGAHGRASGAARVHSRPKGVERTAGTEPQGVGFGCAERAVAARARSVRLCPPSRAAPRRGAPAAAPPSGLPDRCHDAAWHERSVSAAAPRGGDHPGAPLRADPAGWKELARDRQPATVSCALASRRWPPLPTVATARGQGTDAQASRAC
eukprot:30676-Chlamydomonas_euryale.AAC.2